MSERPLFDVRLADPRERKRIAGERARSTAKHAAASSDVRRYGPMAAGAVAALVGVIAAWLYQPAAPPAHAGALALPHVEAKLECSACHVEGEPADDAKKACARCHQGHASRRAGHRQLMASGKLGCVTCHDVHGADQGVRFVAADGGRARRYAVGRSEWEDFRFVSDRDVTIPLIPAVRCAKCHDLAASSDPIARCMLDAQRALAGEALNVCFDEHQAWSAVVPPRPGGVCAAQHGNDRFAAWEVAREVAAEVRALPLPGNDDAALAWLLAGAVGALFGALSFGAGRRLLRRRRVVSAPPIRAAAVVRLPQIDTNTCLGCYACVDACPYDVLQIERYVAVVARPEACCGLTLCQQVCPNGSLVVTDGEPIGDQPRVDDHLQALDVEGVYLAGDVTGLPLIKNAIMQGQRAVANIATSLPKHGLPLDLLIVGAGPAGISAALEAKERGLSCCVLEQGTVAQSIRSFPRGKLVFAQPLELPVAGKLWLQESTKEELLTKWMRIVREERLTIHEGERFAGLERLDGVGFAIDSVRRDEDGDEEVPERRRAARVLLTIGRRGSPRKLDVPLSPQIESKVFYHLADARSFAGQRVLIVGLGDVAMETAIAIGRQCETVVTMSYRGEGFSRGKSRNIAELKRMIDAGRVDIVHRSTLVAIAAAEVTLSTSEGERRLPNDAVFVMIGTRPPTALLEAVGVRMGPTTHDNGDAEHATADEERSSRNFAAGDPSQEEPSGGTRTMIAGEKDE